MTKRVLVLGLIAMLFINCGGSDNIIVKPETQEVDKVLALDDSYEVTENEPIVLTDFLLNDTYKEGNVKITFDKTSVNKGIITESSGKYTYTPFKDFTGADSFKYSLCSSITSTSCDTGTINVTVKASSTTPTGNVGSFNIPSELVAYYNNVDFTLVGSLLKDELATTIISTQTTSLRYTPGVWEALKKSDLDATDNTKVVLIYGYDNADGDYVTDRTRDKTLNGGNAGTEWNREHVYPKSLGTPNLGTSGPGSDAHHLRPCDITFNSRRGNKKFAAGSGNADDVLGGWYPGDEWKGDVARMMMYMYLRYGNQCLPKNAVIGTEVVSDTNMINLLLEWNVEDPVSDFEKNRNNIIKDEQGNRNPFIDNPYLATVIWSGSKAKNTWE